MPVDYSKSKIYKIVDLTTNETYIGSTTEPILARRLAQHVRMYKSYKNGKGRYVTSYKIIENNNYDIQLIELFPCESKDMLHMREGNWIKQTNCVNRYVAGRTKSQYNIDNQIDISLNKKWYRLHHKLEKKLYNKLYNSTFNRGLRLIKKIELLINQ